MVRYTGWYDHTSTAQSELTWDSGLWGWCRAKASCCFILKSWVKHRGKNKIKPCLKYTWNLRRKGKSYSNFSSVKLDGVLLNALCQKTKPLWFSGCLKEQETESQSFLRLCQSLKWRQTLMSESCWDCLVCYVIDNPCDTIPVPSTALLEFSTGFGENWLKSCVCLMC